MGVMSCKAALPTAVDDHLRHARAAVVDAHVPARHLPAAAAAADTAATAATTADTAATAAAATPTAM